MPEAAPVRTAARPPEAETAPVATDARVPTGVVQAQPTSTAAQPERTAAERVDVPDAKAVASPGGPAVEPAAKPTPPVQAAARAPETPPGDAGPPGAVSLPSERQPATEPSPADSASAHPADPQVRVPDPVAAQPAQQTAAAPSAADEQIASRAPVPMPVPEPRIAAAPAFGAPSVVGTGPVSGARVPRDPVPDALATGETAEQTLARAEGALTSVERSADHGVNRHDRAPLPTERSTVARQPALLLE